MIRSSVEDIHVNKAYLLVCEKFIFESVSSYNVFSGSLNPTHFTSRLLAAGLIAIKALVNF